MKRLIVVFTDRDSFRGKGLNQQPLPEEEMRLKRVLNEIRKLFPDMGRTLVSAEYPRISMSSGVFLAQTLGCEFEPFVQGSFYLDQKLTGWVTSSRPPETVIINAMGFGKSGGRPGPDDDFYFYFSHSWNTRCSLFGMPMIPKHRKCGNEAMLVIDYERKEIKWFDDVGVRIQKVTK